uniref:NADPH-dependent FMN reductase n=1 Tax=Solibacter usitatus (strain Ellin6076) TaxID=234267 RepID=Q020A5_SOLUE
MPMVDILAISGSLRSRSTNTAVLEAAAQLAPDGTVVRIWQGLGEIPPFNPDVDVPPAPLAVEAFRAELRAADAVLICSPEYAHGVSGVMKNALDWVVGSGELMEKLVALINASPYATIAHAALAETLRTMSATVVEDASVTLPILSGKPDAAAMVASPEISEALRAAIAALCSRRRLRAGGSQD